jgi:hypothetical protein
MTTTTTAATTTTATNPAKVPTDTLRRTALGAGLLYIATFAFSIPALALYDGVVNDHDFVLGAGSDAGVLWGGLIEILTGLTGIGTAVVLYPVIKRYGPRGAIGFVASRTLEAAMIFVGVISVLGVYTLRQDLAGAAGTDPAALTTTADALVAVKEWTFLLGPGVMAVVNAMFLAPIMYRSGLVPRIIPTIGLVGAPVLLASDVATLFGAHEQVSTTAMLMALPIAAWEFSLGVWMTVKGFRTQPAAGAALPTAPPVPTLSGVAS